MPGRAGRLTVSWRPGSAPVLEGSPDPHFARGELTRLALDVLREAGEPMRIRDVAAAALRRKGLFPPSRTLLQHTAHQLQETFAVLGKRGGGREGGGGKRSPESPNACVI